jgi:hypothetical protein
MPEVRIENKISHQVNRGGQPVIFYEGRGLLQNLLSAWFCKYKGSVFIGHEGGLYPAIDLLHKSPFPLLGRGIKGEVSQKMKIYARGLIFKTRPKWAGFKYC